jgi:FkbM family methyltransferase
VLYRFVSILINLLMPLAGIVQMKIHTFIGKELATDSIAIDLGANVGQFSEELVSKYGCMCFAIEPMPNLLGQIKDSPLIRKLNYAISADNAPVTIYVSRNQEANSLHKAIAATCEIEGTYECPGTTLESLMQRYDISRVDLLKVDIEGAEKMLFDSASDQTLAGVSQITVEFHDFIEGSITTDEVRKIVTRLESIGFFLLPSSYIYASMPRCDFLFINRKACAINMRQWMALYLIKALLILLDLKASMSPRPPATYQ